MKKYLNHILFLSFLGLSIASQAQVGIGTETPHSSTMLDIVASDKAFLGPQIALTSTTDIVTIENPAEGMLVYNTTIAASENLDTGYYFWDGATWQPTGVGNRTNIVSDGVIPSILGYTPTGYNESQTSITVDGTTFTRVGCKVWSGNGHRYCAYKSGENGSYTPPPFGIGTGTLVTGANGVNWGTAFKLGELAGGYLVTLTSLDEWNWVYTNIIQNGTGYDLGNHIWIGNSKAITKTIGVNTSAPGVPIEFFWITGEQSKHVWGNTTTIEHNFDLDNNEPNNLGNTEGCTHTWGTSIYQYTHMRGWWNDAPCDVTTFSQSGANQNVRAMNQLIIEFEN